jgi:hypothetical protein
MVVIDPHLSPSDAAVALRSLDRRYRTLFRGHQDDEAPEDLALRPGNEGWSALGHVVAAARAIGACAAALDMVQTQELPVIDRSVLDPNRRAVDPTPTGTVDEAISELAWEAEALAERIKRVPAERWGRSGRIADTGEAADSLRIVRAAVEAGVSHLKAAERTLDEVRAQPD